MQLKNKKKKLVQAIALSLALSSGMYSTAVVEAMPVPPTPQAVVVTGAGGVYVVAAVPGIPEWEYPGGVPTPVPNPLPSLDDVFGGYHPLLSVNILAQGLNLEISSPILGLLTETGIQNHITINGSMAGAIVTSGQSTFEFADTTNFAGAVENAGALIIDGNIGGLINDTGKVNKNFEGYISVGSTAHIGGGIQNTYGNISIDNGWVEGGIINTKGSIDVSGSVGDRGNIKGTIDTVGGNVDFSRYAEIEVGSDETAIKNVKGDVSISDHSKVTGGVGIEDVGGNVSVESGTVIEGTTGAGIRNVEGNVFVDDKSQVIGATNGIENVKGNVEVSGNSIVEGKNGYGVANVEGTVTIEEGSKIIGTKGAMDNVTADLNMKGVTFTSEDGVAIQNVNGYLEFNSVTVDGKAGGINGVTGAITLTNNTTINSDEGSGLVTGTLQDGAIRIENTTVTAKKDGIDLSGGKSLTTTLNNVGINAAEGNGLNVSDRSQVEINGLDITAGNTGIVAKNVKSLNINTSVDDDKIEAGKIGIHIADGTDATIGGTADLKLNVGKNQIGTESPDSLGAGIYVSDASFDVNKGGKVITMELAGSTAGLAGSGKDSVLNFNNENNSIKTAAGGADYAVGINSSKSATVNMDKGTIDLTGKDVVGVMANYSGNANLSNLGDQMKLQATDGVGVGALADGGTVNVSNTKITVSGTGTADAIGLQGTTAGKINLSYDADKITANPALNMNVMNVSTSGSGTAMGIVSKGLDTSINLSNLENLEVTAKGTGDATGIWAEGGSKVEVNVDLAPVLEARDADLGEPETPVEPEPKTKTISVSTEGAGMAIGVVALHNGTSVNLGDIKNLEVAAKGTGDAVGISVADGATFTDTLETLDVNAAGGNAIGMQATNKSTINLDLAGNLTVTAGKSAIGVAASDSVVNLEGNSEFTSSLIVKGTEPSTALAVDSAGQINLTNMSVALDEGTTGTLLLGTKNGGTVNATNSVLAGHTIYDATDSVAGESNRLGINLDKNSLLVGSVNVVNSDADKDAAIDVNVAGYWYMTGDSDTNGTLNNTGIVDFAPQDENKLTYSTLKVDKLTGDGGTYMVNTTIHNADTYLDANNRQADLIVATGSGSDATGSIFIKNDDTKVAWYQARMDQALAITAPDSTAEFTLANGQNAYELGSWAYQLTSETISQAEADKLYGGNYAGATGWHLQNFDLSNQATAALSSVVSPDIWYLETNALYSNINQYDREKDNSNVWAQAMHGKIETNDTVSHAGYNGSNNVEQKFSGLTAGLDKKFSSSDRGDFWGGLMFGHGTGDISYYSGSTDTKSTHVGLYGIYRGSNDWYMGGVLKYNRYSNDISAISRAGQHIANDYSQHGWGASLMAGKKIMRDNGWFVEPQIEFGYNKVSGTNYTFGNGMDVNIGDSSSLRLRGGVAIGRQHLYNDGAKLDTYLKLSLVHEFDGESTVNLYGEPFGVDYGGTWGQYKLGMNFTSAKNTDFNVALTYENGGGRKSPLGVEAGVKWSF